MPAANPGVEIGIFEAMLGSAQDIGGADVANPIALLLSAVLMLRHIGEGAIVGRIMKAAGKVLNDGRVRTRHLDSSVTTTVFAEALARRVAPV